jgi:hypothetical protein
MSDKEARFEEAVEEPPFGTEKLIGICRYTGDWIEVESTDESCPHGDCDCGLAFYTAGLHLETGQSSLEKDIRERTLAEVEGRIEALKGPLLDRIKDGRGDPQVASIRVGGIEAALTALKEAGKE